MILVMLLALAMTPAAAGATDKDPVIDRSGRFDHGVSFDPSGMKGTIIGTYLQHNAGTGVWTNLDARSQNWLVRWDSGIVQRLLELAALHRTGTPETIVNEAVAKQFGYVCASYLQLPAAMRGCTPGNIPTYSWPSPAEVRQAAEQLGFICEPETATELDCTFRGGVTRHPVKFAVSPLVDGVREGSDQVYDDMARLHFAQGSLPVMKVTEAARQ